MPKAPEKPQRKPMPLGRRFKPGESGNPAGPGPGKTKPRRVKDREVWRAGVFDRVTKVFEEMLDDPDPEVRRRAATELRKAVIPDLRPIDADTGDSADRVIVVLNQASADALEAASESARGVS